MGSHYIQVGKLKIDKDLLDIACPAAGYGSTPPPPQIYCPAAGYVLQYPEYVPPVGVVYPESVPQSIIFTCNSNFGIWSYLSFAKAGTSSSYVYEVFDLLGNLINSTTTPLSVLTFSFPEPKGYYIVRVTLTNPGGYFTTMTSSLSNQYYVIENIIFNTPNFTTMYNSCKYMGGLRNVQFNCTLDLLTSFQSAFQYSGLYQFKFLDSYPALITANYMFQYCGDISIIEFPSTCDLPLLSSLSFFASNTSMKTILFPTSVPALTLGTHLCRDSTNLKEVRLFTNAPALINLTYAFSNTAITGEIVIKMFPALTNGTFLFGTNNPLTKIGFDDNSTVVCDFNNALYLDRKITEIVYPSIFGSSNSLGISSQVLQKVVCPGMLLAGSTQPVSHYLNNYSPNLETVTGDFDNSAQGTCGQLILSHNPLSLKVWNTPKLRVDNIRVGATGAAYWYEKLEVLEVDWINSPWTTVGPSGYHIQMWADVSDAWLDALFTKLPTVSGKSIDVTNCTGYPTCDKTIATAKGWTVL